MLRTPVVRQRAIVNYFNQKLSALQPPVKLIKKIKDNELQVRAKIIGDFSGLLKSIVPCTLENLGVIGRPISDSYDAYVLTIKKAVPGAQQGDQCYFVPATKAGAQTSQKEFTPDQLGIAGKKIPISSLKQMVHESLKRKHMDELIREFLYDVFDSSGSVNGRLSGKTIDQIDERDIKAITNDFGEIAGAYWYAKQSNRKVDAIEFPIASNQGLFDYYAYVGNQKILISAKAGGGSAPSMKNLAPVIREKKYSAPHKNSARKAILTIDEESGENGILVVAKLLQTKAYKYLKQNVFKKDYTVADIEEYLTGFHTGKQASIALKDFYAHINRNASNEAFENIYQQNMKKSGLILSPMAYSLVEEMNQNKDLLDVMNEAASSIQVTQIYMEVPKKTTKKVEFYIKKFETSKFIFEYHANAYKPGNNKIGFKVVK